MGNLRAFNLGILLLVCINIILVGGGETEVINNVINLEYSLNIDLKNEVANDGVDTLDNKHKFVGTVNIKFEVVDDVKELELHCGKLVITEKPTLTWTQPGSIEESGKSLRLPTCDPHTHKMKIKNNFVSKNTYKIFLEYDGHLRDDTKGLYHSTYRIPNDFIRHIYGADFLGDMAKYAFPHFGDNLEGKFYISIVHSPVYKVLSNVRSVKGLVKLPEKVDSPEVEEELVSEAIDSPLDESAFLYESRFVAVSTSPSKLSFLIGHFKETKVELPPSDDNLFNSISIWTKPEVEAEGMLFANSMIVSFFEFFQKYFLPLKSIDNFEIIALYDGPSYNPSNINKLGTVAFRESELRSLDGRDLSPERVLFVIESLANGMLIKFFDQIPKRVVWSRDAMIQNLIGVLVSHALNEEITLNAGSLIDGRMLETMEYDTLEIHDNIQEDSVVLYRESFVIRMLAMSLYEKEDVFLSYLSQYFVNSKNPRYILPFSKYLTNEYFKKLGNGITAEGIIQSWNSSKHLPVLHVDQEGTDVVVKQKLYPKKIEHIKEYVVLSEEDDKYSALDIPLTYTTLKELNFEETRPKFWLTAAQPKITLDNILQDPQDCAIVNIQLIARVRVVYSKRNLGCLIKFLSADPKKIHELNVYQLVDDVFDAAWYGYDGTDYGLALELLKSLKNERRYIVWLAAYNVIMKLNNILKGTPIHVHFQELIRELIEEIYYDLFPYSIESEELLRSTGIPPKVQLRPLIFEIACVMNFPDAVLRAKTAFLKWVNEQYRIPEPFVYTVFSTAARQNIDKFVKILTDQYNTTPLRRQKTIVLLALGCYEDFTGKSRSHALQFLSNINVFQLKDLYDEIFKQPYTYSIAKNSLYLNLDTIKAIYEKYPKVLENRERKFLRLLADNPHSHVKELSELDPAIWGKYEITEITNIADQYKYDRKRWLDLQYDEVSLLLTV